MRKLRFIFSAVFIILTCAFFNISASADTTYSVGTDTEWLDMINSVNALSSTSDVVINITDDIDLANVSAYSNALNIRVQFQGTINGNGHIISNLTFTNSEQFGGLINDAFGATINNLTLYNCTLNDDYGNVGSMYHGVGFFIGRARLCTLYNCYSVNNTLTGAIVNDNSFVGGLVGYAYYTSSSFDLCYNFSDIALTQTAFLGGICGYDSIGCTFSRCANYGDLGFLSLSSSGKQISCGIAFISYATARQTNFKHCYNLGNLYAYLCGAITVNYQNHSLSEYISNYSYVDIQGYQNLSLAFGSPFLLNFDPSSVAFTHLYNYTFVYDGFSNVSGFYTFADGLREKSQITQDLIDEMNNGYVVYQLDSDNINNGFPVFAEGYAYLHDVIFPLINGGGSAELPDNWVSLDGRAEGTYDSETGTFEYNITVNSPDYSGVLGNSSYTGGNVSFSGTEDDYGLDITDTSAFDSLSSIDFTIILSGFPLIMSLFTLLFENLFGTAIIFVLFLTLIIWFIGRKV
ncbi:MAG: hypothetical protein IJO29_00275 [Oscillospiraceae bacterium]|nr:hypothetical protein [Oscillospiraceae bacterium]